MRITSNQLANLVRRSVAGNTEKLYKIQEKVSTQKSVNRPSDDPLAMGRILGYRTTLASIEQYSRNIEQAKTNIKFGEIQLEEVYEQLSTAKNMAIDQSSGDMTTRLQTAEDIQNISDRLLDLANTKLGDDYIFAGYKSGSEPVDCAEVTCGSASKLSGGEYFIIDSSPGYYVWYNIDGSDVDPAPTGMTGIEVGIGAGDSPTEVAAKTVLAINGGGVFSSSASTSDPTRIEILENGDPPEIADSSTGFTMRTVKYEETPPFTPCAEISFCDPSDLEDGDYFTLGDDYFVWYDTIGDGSGEPTVPGRSNAIAVNINGAGSADDVAARTAAAIVLDGAFEASVTEDATNRMQILDNETAPEIAEEMDTAFTLHTVKYNGDDGDLNFIVSKTLKIKGNATGDDVFTGDGLSDGVNVFDLLKELKDAFKTPTLDSDWINNIKDNLIKGSDQVQNAAVDFSVAYTRLESTENYWSQFKLTVENMLSENEDVDLAQAIVALQHQETVYEAALAASAKLFNQSLIDFLR
jgi:flagellin-like hook-associated protein FlgL